MDDTNPDDAIVRAPRSQQPPAAPQEPQREQRESPSDIAAITDDDDDAHAPELDPRRAFEVLEIRTPLEEFDAYVRARVDTLTRLGDSKKAELTAAALDLGRRALARVTGAPLNPPEKAPR